MEDRPLLARHDVAGVLIGAATVGALTLGVRYAGRQSAGHLDRAIDRRVSGHLRGQQPLLRDLITIGDPWSILVLCIVLCALFVATGRARLAALAVLGPATAAGLAEFVLKPVFGRRFGDALSFPSGHTTGAVAVALVLVVWLLGPDRPGWPSTVRWAGCVVVLGLAGAVATALVGARYHYATDTVGGFCVAVAAVLGVAWGIDLAARPRSGARPDADVRGHALPRVGA